MNNFSIEISDIVSQIYILPFIKITHNKHLNGKYEFIIGWLNKELIIGF